MTGQVLERKHFKLKRSLEYFQPNELIKMTGQSKVNFPLVMLKELIDNALDISETSNVLPEVEIKVGISDRYNKCGDNLWYISVKDNGKGFPLNLIKDMLDFETRTSDKTVYKAPTRGAQGNALKTIFAIPLVLRDERDETDRPIIIESLGERYEINISIDQIAQSYDCEIKSSSSDIVRGTKIKVCFDLMKSLPDEAMFMVMNFAFFNSHVKFIVDIVEYEQGEILPTDLEYKKFTPRDLTSAHWYTSSDFQKLAYANIREDENRSCRDFISEFRNMKKKEKRVLKEFPDMKILGDFRNGSIPKLLSQIKSVATKPAPGVLGSIGKENFQGTIDDQFGLIDDTYCYKKIEGEFRRDSATIPYVIEVAFAEVEDTRFERKLIIKKAWETKTVIPKDIIGLNHSVVYTNPFYDVTLSYMKGNSFFYGSGLNDYLSKFKIEPDDKVVLLIHLLCPNLEYTDHSKSRIVAKSFADDLAEAIYHTCKDHYRKKKREEKAKKEEYKENYEDELDIKKAVFEVLPEAISQASNKGKLPFSARSLYYAVRPLIQKYTSKNLKYNPYFTPTLLTEYQEKNGAIKGLYYDPRGHLAEPHSAEVYIPLGTQNVAKYKIPEYVYNKILYIEKKGPFEVLKKVKTLDKYDLAVIAGEGYATRAVKEVLSKIEKEADITIFCLHDCDQDGFKIVRTLREETRTSEYVIEIIDIGLRPQDVWEMNLPTEEVIYRKSPERGLRSFVESGDLTREEYNWLVGKKIETLRGEKWITYYEAKRCELDALGSQGLIDLIERRFDEYGATDKVIPPKEKLEEESDEKREEYSRTKITDIIKELLGGDEAIDKMYEELGIDDELDIESEIKKGFEENPTNSWRDELGSAIEGAIDKGLEDIEADDKIKDQLIRLVGEKFQK